MEAFFDHFRRLRFITHVTTSIQNVYACFSFSLVQKCKKLQNCVKKDLL